jgi:hypothetical protein
MMPRLTLLLLVCVAAPPAKGQVPDGYYIGESVFLPDSARESLAGGSFHITIERVFADSIEARILALAERLFPDSAAIVRVASRETLPRVVSGLEAAAMAPGNRWWWSSFDNAWTPYAVTGAAVQYYRQWMYGRASAGKSSGEFVYRAYVERLSTSRKGQASFAVRMELSVDYLCGILCGMSFRAERRVLFDIDGIPLRIEGDGKPTVIVS